MKRGIAQTLQDMQAIDNSIEKQKLTLVSQAENEFQNSYSKSLLQSRYTATSDSITSVLSQSNNIADQIDLWDTHENLEQIFVECLDFCPPEGLLKGQVSSAKAGVVKTAKRITHIDIMLEEIKERKNKVEIGQAEHDIEVQALSAAQELVENDLATIEPNISDSETYIRDLSNQKDTLENQISKLPAQSEQIQTRSEELVQATATIQSLIETELEDQSAQAEKDNANLTNVQTQVGMESAKVDDLLPVLESLQSRKTSINEQIEDCESKKSHISKNSNSSHIILEMDNKSLIKAIERKEIFLMEIEDSFSHYIRATDNYNTGLVKLQRAYRMGKRRVDQEIEAHHANVFTAQDWHIQKVQAAGKIALESRKQKKNSEFEAKKKMLTEAKAKSKKC